ncbi:MAG: NF038122 family metalloprotease [Acetobacteraceae bacterium]
MIIATEQSNPKTGFTRLPCQRPIDRWCGLRFINFVGEWPHMRASMIRLGHDRTGVRQADQTNLVSGWHAVVGPLANEPGQHPGWQGWRLDTMDSIMNRSRHAPKAFGVRVLSLAGALALATIPVRAHALAIDPVFGGSITGSSSVAEIEGAIDSAIGTIDGLYANPVTIPISFTYTAAASGNLLSTSQAYYGVTYGAYVAGLSADAGANPQNTVLAMALANLAQGNDATGARNMAITGAQATMLGFGPETPADATININSNQNFAFSGTASSSQYDLVGGLEHEIDEVLGGGGGGSTLNSIAGSCATSPAGFFCDKYGALDLYRYSADGTPSFTTSSDTTSYLSVDGGATSVVAFNQFSGGDYGDFSPSGTGAGQLIQNAFNTTGQDEPYTTNSPEFLMEEAIGWDPVPEPSALALLLPAILGMVGVRRRRRHTGRL